MSASSALDVEARAWGSGPVSVLEGDARAKVRVLRYDARTCANLGSALTTCNGNSVPGVALTAADVNTTFVCAVASHLVTSDQNLYIVLPALSEIVGKTLRFVVHATPRLSILVAWNPLTGQDSASTLICAGSDAPAGKGPSTLRQFYEYVLFVGSSAVDGDSIEVTCEQVGVPGHQNHILRAVAISSVSGGVAGG